MLVIRSMPVRVVTVCFAPGEDADWFAASEKVNDLLHADGVPARRYHVRHRRLLGWLTRWFGYFLLDAARRFGAITVAAGGRKSRLDLTATAARAATRASLRWRAWNVHIAHTTRPARPWEDFLAQHYADPRKVPLTEARRRFEQQPRVLAMLGYADGHTFDPYELSVYQAGEVTYVGLYWRIALIGDALITTDGRLLMPATTSVADRFRFLNAACAYLRSLRGNARVCAVAIA
ncbi:hypothetical protein ONA91_35725 [Micromonospora sp. DR5-3]|uniref:hypothetical protein n=1 Tax=unclassified Micromonospora TaxID=2617518 RepID=UPI0011D7AF94|nr:MULTISPECIES: hypothetical protein [unclassified Micromonospora]MCW3819799.1 hypothetical protein [Micromonospora sp. DR5-3]TYC19631.1 hypothetical protein FXF52_35550 [Micromonospora sp. MP36]